MASNAELQAEVDRLNAEADELAAENERLTAELEEVRSNQVVLPNTNPQPTEPSFKLTEGNRAELEARGHTISPFTGARLVGTGVEDVREVDQETYDKVAREAAKAETETPNKGTSFPKV
jgi:predicted nuclease with TOPRIM domain